MGVVTQKIIRIFTYDVTYYNLCVYGLDFHPKVLVLKLDLVILKTYLHTNILIVIAQTRMHSSRMRTDRSSSRLGVYLSACWDTHPSGCGPGDTPPAIPLNFPLGVGLETCKACWDTTPQESCCNACWDTPPDRMTDTCKNITFANFVCGQ